MKVEEMHIGQKVRQKNHKFEMTVVCLGVNSIDMRSPYVYCDFEGNNSVIFECYKPEELEEVK